MKQHPVAAGLWLAICLTGIAFIAVKGQTRRDAEDAGTQAPLPERVVLREKLYSAIALSERGEHARALVVLEDLVEQHPRTTSLWLNLGIAQRAAGRLTEAARTFEKVLELDPEDYDAVAEKATVLKQEGRVDAAIAELERIPVRRGRIGERLAADPLWQDIAEDPRMRALRDKHGLVDRLETSNGVVR